MKLTTTQIAAKLGVSERTIQRWIASGKLPTRQLAQNLYLVEEFDLNNLTKYQTSDEEISILRLHVETLEHRIRLLEDIVGKLTSHRSVDTQQTVGNEINVRGMNKGLLGLKVVSVRSFAKQHDLTWEQIQSLIKKDAFEVTYRPYGNNGNSSQVLTARQQANVIAYLQDNSIPFKQCKYCPHQV